MFRDMLRIRHCRKHIECSPRLSFGGDTMVAIYFLFSPLLCMPEEPVTRPCRLGGTLSVDVGPKTLDRGNFSISESPKGQVKAELR